MMQKPIFNDVLQIAIVVRNLDASVDAYENGYGIGPWEFHEFLPGDVEDLVKDDAPAQYGMRIALATVGRVQWELIQPIDDRSNYAEFLREKGEGVHHIQVAVDNYDDITVSAAADRAYANSASSLAWASNSTGSSCAPW